MIDPFGYGSKRPDQSILPVDMPPCLACGKRVDAFGCEEMQAIRLVLNHLAIRCAMDAGAPTRDVLRLLGLQEVVIDWVMSVHEDPS